MIEIYRIVLACVFALIFTSTLDLLRDYLKDNVRRNKLRLKSVSKIIKKNRRREILESRDGLISGATKKVDHLILMSKYNLSMEKLVVLTLLTSTVGVFVGIVLRNSFIALPLGIISGYTPILFFRMEIKKNIRQIESALPMALGNIIAQYMSEEDFVIAVSKKLDQLPKPLRIIFNSFVTQVQVLNRDVIEALKELKYKVDNYYFREFIELAIQTEIQGSKLKYTMLSIPEDMRCVQQVQEEFDLIRKKYNRDFIACIVFFPLNLLILRTGYSRYYTLLTNTFVGKIGMLVIVIVILGCTAGMFYYNKQIKLEME